jgi:hypothetical protein
MLMRAARNLVLSFAIVGLTGSNAAFASDVNVKGNGSCSIHIWQRGIYISESASNFGAFGLIGGVLQSQYDRKYPAASVEGVIEDVLNINALPVTVASVDWHKYTGAEHNSVVFEPGVTTNSRLKELKAGTARNSEAKDVCYIELYVGAQTFSGGGIKSHLFSEFYARTYYGGAQKQSGAILWDQTPHLSVKDADTLIQARSIIADGFVSTLTKFLAKKLPKPKISA